MTTDPRLLIVEVSHLLAARNFTTATGGNISVRMPDGTLWATPSRLHKARVQVEDLVCVNADGKLIAGMRTPSSETQMHQAVYRALPQAGAVIHAHPPYATGFAQAGKIIGTAVSSEAYVILGAEVPLIDYARPGTEALAAAVSQAMQPCTQAYLLANHGVLTWADDLWGAYDILDTLELYAQSLLVAHLLGGGIPIPDEELAWLASKAITVPIPESAAE